MRILRLLLLVLPLSAHAEQPFGEPIRTPGGGYQAQLSKTYSDETKREGIRLVVCERDGKGIFDAEIAGMGATNARWTENGRFLVVLAKNGAGHSPWHTYVYVFSIADREIRRLDDSRNCAFTADKIWSQPPDTVILLAHDSTHGFEWPDDPILLRFRLGKVWPTLKR